MIKNGLKYFFFYCEVTLSWLDMHSALLGVGELTLGTGMTVVTMLTIITATIKKARMMNSEKSSEGVKLFMHGMISNEQE